MTSSSPPAAASSNPAQAALPRAGTLPALLAGALVTAREPWEFDPALAAEELARQFGVRSAEALGLVPEDALAIGRARQTTKAGRAKVLRAERAAAKAARKG